MRGLARLRRLRGTPLDIFGYSAERRAERALITEFEANVTGLLAGLDADKLPLAVEIAKLPQRIRGFGHVKERNALVAHEERARLMTAYRDSPTRPAPAPERETV